MFGFKYIRYLPAVFIVFIVGGISSCKKQDGVQPYVFENLSVSTKNNNLVFTVDKIIRDTSSDTAYELVLLSVTKDDCEHDCNYWEIALGSEDQNTVSVNFTGTIMYGETPNNLHVRTGPKPLSKGQYTIGASVKVYKKPNQAQPGFSAIGKVRLIKDRQGKWAIL